MADQKLLVDTMSNIKRIQMQTNGGSVFLCQKAFGSLEYYRQGSTLYIYLMHAYTLGGLATEDRRVPGPMDKGYSPQNH